MTDPLSRLIAIGAWPPRRQPISAGCWRRWRPTRKIFRERQEELEKQLIAAPATTWPEAAEKARYRLGLLASTAIAQDPRRKRLSANVLEDFVSLSEAKDA